ncbi:PKD domain-containing protein [Methanoregula sp.]|uniref:PKD domain-containing protein n=1 Tax=Methanoregula sp. TaxID=2052170 RepID=UPI0035641CE9
MRKQRVFTGVLLSVVCIIVFFILPASAASVPVAGFVSNVTSGTMPLSVQFLDLSTRSPTEWIWSFGDGETSTAQNPAHTYIRAGTYTVTLAATNSGGSNMVTMTEYITATRPVTAPAAFFISNVTTGTEPVAVQFLDSSTNSPTSWYWSFGDGSISTGASPLHTYTRAGVYTVALTATNAAGSDTVTRTGFITVGAPATDTPVARFVSTVNSGTVPQTVQFIDASTNFPVSWYWSFGDGGTSTLQNPLHTYSRIGNYTVSLTATNAWGNHTVTRDNYMNVGSSIPVASFIATPAYGPVPLSVQFTDTSQNSPTTWDWEFGDGNTSAMQNPAYEYTVPGVYTVTFSAMNAAGRGTTIRNDYISVVAPSPPVASFTSDVREGTAPLTIQFSDSSTNSPTFWAWSFGDGSVSVVKNPSHSYTGRGSYTVTLIATNAGGSSTSTMNDYITVSGQSGSSAVTAVRETAEPAGPSPAPAAVTVTPAPVTPPVVTTAPNPIISALADTSSGISPLMLILAVLLVAGVVIAWWLMRSPKRSRRQRGRDL